jgi:hypothetical protein
VLSPRRTTRMDPLSVLPVASVAPDIQQDFPPAAATIPGFPFSGCSALLSVDFALPLISRSRSASVMTYRGSTTSGSCPRSPSPADASLDNILLRNAVENQNSGQTSSSVVTPSSIGFLQAFPRRW